MICSTCGASDGHYEESGWACNSCGELTAMEPAEIAYSREAEAEDAHRAEEQKARRNAAKEAERTKVQRLLEILGRLSKVGFLVQSRKLSQDWDIREEALATMYQIAHTQKIERPERDRKNVEREKPVADRDLLPFRIIHGAGGKTETSDVPVVPADAIAVAEAFILETSHGTASDVLFQALHDTVIFERVSIDGRGEFYKKSVGCFWEQFPDIRTTAREILETAIDLGFAHLSPKMQSRSEIKTLYESTGKARIKARTKDFLASTLALFSERVMVFPSVPWNATEEVIPTLTGVLDFSGDQLVSRSPRPEEFFRDPVPCTAEEILQASEIPHFTEFMDALFPDTDTQASARMCLAICAANKPRKTFQLWTNADGDGGKNTLFDLLRRLLPGRIVMAKNALILHRGDSGERRFGEIEMMGKSGVFFDEVGGTFDVAQIKRYTSLSSIRGEAKGRDPVEFQQTWALVALCNQLPRFTPADDNAFLSRLFVLPFQTVFYSDALDYQRRIARGVDPRKLKPAKEKTTLLDALVSERPGILRVLTETWIDMRRDGGQPFESQECRNAKEIYRRDNDLAERFFEEYLDRDELGRVPYDNIKSAWSEFFGETKPVMREIIPALLKRFPFMSKKRAHGAHVLGGVRLKMTSAYESVPSYGDNTEDF